jgi:phosphoglycolate phosphatase
MALATQLMADRISFDAILFDLDGTLADSAEDITRALTEALVSVGLAPPAQLKMLVDGSPLEEVFAIVTKGRVDQALFSSFASAYREAYERCGHTSTSVFPGVRDTLEALSALTPKISLAVATTKRAQSANSMLEAIDLRKYFDAVVGSSGTHLPHKPAPDLLLHICDQLSVDPARALMVGDTLRDIEAGKRANMRTAAVTFGMGQAETLINARPDFVLEEFDDLLVLMGLE